MEKEEKKCRGCGETKLLSEYHKKKTGKYGRDSKCKLCKKAYNKKYRKSESAKKALKKYRETGKYIETKKKYEKSEAGKVTKKKYQTSEKGRAWQKSWQKNRRHNDPVYKLHRNLSSSFGIWMKGNQKTCRTAQYVGCSYKELLDHLESQFDEGMSWENQGEWHIDHFKAQSRFDPAIEEEAFMCWHYTNLQPMWASENISCGNKKKPGDENRIWMGREIGWINISI